MERKLHAVDLKRKREYAPPSFEQVPREMRKFMGEALTQSVQVAWSPQRGSPPVDQEAPPTRAALTLQKVLPSL